MLALALCCAGAAAREPEKITILYLEPESEMKLSAAVRRGGLPLRVYRIGVTRNGDRLFAVIDFHAKDASRDAVFRQAWALARRSFAALPALYQLDLVGVDRLEVHRFRKPDRFFTASIRRDRLGAVPNTWPPARQIGACSEVFVSPELLQPPPGQERLADAVATAWYRSRPRMPRKGVQPPTQENSKHHGQNSHPDDAHAR